MSEYDEFIEASEAKYGKWISNCPYHHRPAKTFNEICRVFEIENTKETAEQGYFFNNLSPHEKASIRYLVPKHPLTSSKEGDIEISVKAENECTRTDTNGRSYVVPPSTSIAIFQKVGDENKILASASYDSYIDISDRKKVSALLNGLYGKPSYAKDMPKVLECFNDFVYKENDLSSAKKYCKVDIAMNDVKRKKRKSTQQEFDKQNAIISARIKQEKEAEINREKNAERPQEPKRSREELFGKGILDKIRDKLFTNIK